MMKEDVTKNKIIVMAKEIGELTEDPDLSYRKIAKVLGKTGGRIAQIYSIYKKKYKINHLLKVKKGRKLSTK